VFSNGLKSAGVAFALMVFAAPAFADAIDGDWCQKDGRRLSIRGPQIVTPGGKQLEGEYARHSFSFIVPPTEPGAGETAFMQLLDENTVHLRHGTAADSVPETWIRCSPSTSGLLPMPPA
jgi:hypothetical protein